jgi:toxin-antitoxin system PIN domain toxin
MYLFDVNVLIATGDPGHVFHDSIHQWLARHKGANWATCPLTENGFIRVLSQPGYRSGPISPAEAMRLLTDMKAGTALRHVFWADSVSLTEGGLFRRNLIAGARQVTDIYLAGLALRNQGRLVTYDQGVAWQAVSGAAADLIVNPPV